MFGKNNMIINQEMMKMKKILLLPVAALLLLSIVLQGCGNSENTNNANRANNGAAVTANDSGQKGLGMSAETFIANYNKVIDNFVKKGISNANYYRIDINKVNNNTIVLDGAATLAWHVNEGYIDAVTLVIVSQSTQLDLCEASAIVAATGNKELVQMLIDRVNANEREIKLNSGDIFIMRQANVKVSSEKNGNRLLVCTQKYHNEMENMVKNALQRNSQTTNNTSTNKSNNLVALDDNHNVQSFGHEMNKIFTQYKSFYLVDGEPIQVLEWKVSDNNAYSILFNDQTESHIIGSKDSRKIKNIILMSEKDNELSKQTLPAKLIVTLNILGVSMHDSYKFVEEVYSNPFLEHKYEHREKNRIYMVIGMDAGYKNMFIISATPIH